ncbi:MAG: hypothetical protein ACLR01_02220 [Vescimonas sp.]
MLSIWIGRAGAGKSRRVLETMARQRSQRAAGAAGAGAYLP